MKEISKELLKKQYDKLPSGLQSVLKDVNLPARIQNIIKKYGLRVDDGGVFEDQVMLVLLGLAHPDEFVANLLPKLNLPLKTVENLVIDAENEIFLPVRESLMKMFPTEEHQAVLEKPTAPVTQQPIQSVVYPQKPIAQPTVPQQTSAIPPINLPTAPQSTTQTPPKDVVQTKLEQSFRMPATNTTVKEGAPVAPKVVDPYREAVE